MLSIKSIYRGRSIGCDTVVVSLSCMYNNGEVK